MNKVYNLVRRLLYDYKLVFLFFQKLIIYAMKYASIILIVIFCFHLTVYSQVETTTKLIDNDKETYENNVFNKEFQDKNDTLSLDKKLYDKIPEKLPEWVFQPYTHNGSYRIVGFSDPNMDKEEAFKQAILRAKALLGLFNSSNTSNITDDYTNLIESGKYSLYSTKFQDFSVSKVKIPYNNSNVRLIDTFYTKYNEGIALIEIDYVKDSTQNTDTIEVKAEHLQVFIERDFKKEKIEFYNLSIKDILSSDSSNIISQYNYKKVNRGFDISSIHGNKEINFIERTYNYRTNLNFNKDSTDLDYNYFRLSNGLWNGYITGILVNISSISKQLSGQVKNSNDFYTLKNQGLIRTVSRNKLTFSFSDFKLLENQFYINIQGKLR